MFPPINTHSRPPSEDLHGVSSGGVADIPSASKQQQIRRQPHTIDQQRRSPLRSNSLLTPPTAAVVALLVVLSFLTHLSMILVQLTKACFFN
jgi:hypothetical protein